MLWKYHLLNSKIDISDTMKHVDRCRKAVNNGKQFCVLLHLLWKEMVCSDHCVCHFVYLHLLRQFFLFNYIFTMIGQDRIPIQRCQIVGLNCLAIFLKMFWLYMYILSGLGSEGYPLVRFTYSFSSLSHPYLLDYQAISLIFLFLLAKNIVTSAIIQIFKRGIAERHDSC